MVVWIVPILPFPLFLTPLSPSTVYTLDRRSTLISHSIDSDFSPSPAVVSITSVDTRRYPEHWSYACGIIIQMMIKQSYML
ncbi:hypothetical protein L6452_20137 [Arctium lappa]|uniref:Uncharacterized protein n=1 Tax=Arctium lappa TaxID=4217 RepID=A0ACB9B9S8_ARCLA|nr:hypothetical protein L6452_20137 [Arctium lappa]